MSVARGGSRLPQTPPVPTSSRAEQTRNGADGSTEAGREGRYRELMERYLGPRVVEAFADDDVTEVYVNGDGRLRLDTHSRGKVLAGVRLRAARVEQFLHAVAAFHGDALHGGTPTVQAELPDATFGGARLQGFLSPLAEASCFVIRKRASRVFDLDSYVPGVMTAEQRIALRDAVVAHENILVCGGTGSGKTTLCNALLKEMTDLFPEERIVVLEDTGELQCAADDHLQLRTSDDVSLADLVRHTLRCTPDRIVVGEVRDEAALHLLDAWATGHPGGCATLHATTALGALHRLGRLAQRANVPPQHELVAEAVGVVLVIQGGNQGRRVTELVRVDGQTEGTYDLSPV